MANDKHLKILMQGVDVWNQWRKDNPEIEPDLREVDLPGSDLNGINLGRAKISWAKLIRANLGFADLYRADLGGAKLIEANLAKANLRGANLAAADLSNADLMGAKLVEANLGGSDLHGANLLEAKLTAAFLVRTKLSKANFDKVVMLQTVIVDVDLSEAKGLETVENYGPSTIGIDTLYRSQGKIPLAFLRGAGVPESFIRMIHDIGIGGANQLYSCFISYSTEDQEFAERLHSDLQSKGVRCWFAPEDLKGGRKLHEQIPEAIRLSDKLLLVLSENSMDSQWVKTEIYHARQEEIRTGKRKLFPIGLIDFEEIRKWQAFDADVGKDMAREIREYFIPDFSDWKNHDSYKKAFDRLLRDLQAGN